MICKYCGAEAEDGAVLCPECGKPLEEEAADAAAEAAAADEAAVETAPVEAGVTEDAAEPAPGAGDSIVDQILEEARSRADVTPEEVPEPAVFGIPEEAPAVPAGKKKEPVWLIAALCVAAVAAAAILIFALVRGGKGKDAAPGDAAADVPSAAEQAGAPSAEPGSTAAAEPAAEEEKEPAPTYTVPNDQITAEMASAAAAACGGRELTNAELSYYYWNQFYSLANVYGEYLSFILDPTQPLSEQPSSEDPERSWEEALLDAALDTFRQTTAIVKTAEAAGFDIDQENIEYLETMPETLASNAERMGLESADEFLQQLYGPYADVESYTRFVRDSLISYEYLNQLFDKIEYGPEDVDAWFDENREMFEGQGLSKDEPNMVNVRHILIKPAAEAGEDGETAEPTDKDWVDAKNRAEALLAEWQAGDATEDAFAVLASENTEDPGSQGTGGLYEGVYPGEMVAAFNDWCFDGSRKPGDTGIVETEYGYHIMYFSGTQDHARWYDEAERDNQSSRHQEILDWLTADYPLQKNYDNIVLTESKALQ